MSEIVAVLVVPAAGDPGGLLANGPCGAEPPEVVSGHVCAYDYHREWQPVGDFHGSDCYMCRHPKSALPLWWVGALVPEGWDRARRVPIPPFGPWPRDPTCALESEMLARRLVAAGLASRVVRLARVDGRLVEVP